MFRALLLQTRFRSRFPAQTHFPHLRRSSSTQASPPSSPGSIPSSSSSSPPPISSSSIAPGSFLRNLDKRILSFRKIKNWDDLLAKISPTKKETKSGIHTLSSTEKTFKGSVTWTLFGLGLVSFLAYYGYKNQEVVPISGRKRINWLPKILEYSFIFGVDEHWTEATKNDRLPTTSPQHLLVEKVGNRLTSMNGLKMMTHHVIQGDQVNAFVTPGGHVYVYTAMLDFLKNENELGIVLGHEMSHKIAKHSIDELILNLLKHLLSLITSSDLLGSFAEIALTLPYSRKFESEADHMGLIYAARAGFNPKAALSVWTRMAMLENGEGGIQVTEKDGEYIIDTPHSFDIDAYLSTHPSNQERIYNFRPDGEWMTEARKEYEKYLENAKNSSQTESRKGPLGLKSSFLRQWL